MLTAPVGLVCLLMRAGTKVSTSLTTPSSWGRALRDGRPETGDHFPFFGMGDESSELLELPPRGLGLGPPVPPTSRPPRPPFAIDREIDENCSDGKIGDGREVLKAEANSAPKRERATVKSVLEIMLR